MRNRMNKKMKILINNRQAALNLLDLLKIVVPYPFRLVR